MDSEFETCAEACEADALGCAEDIHSHINGAGFIERRSIYPTTHAEQPNPTTPMHGLFNTMYVNPQAHEAIRSGIAACPYMRASGGSGVPVFAFNDRLLVTGAQETATFLQVFEKLAADAA